MTKVAVLVHSCDRYAFLYQGFEHFFNTYWDRQINCNYYFATELMSTEVQGFENIKSGSGAWADRLIFLLKNVIKEDYVLYFQEDMWLRQKVSATFFNQLFDLAQQNNWKQVKLHSAEVYQTIPTNDFIQGFNVSLLNNETSQYLMSHQITLWDRQFFCKLLGKNEHPWRNERKGTQRLRKMNPEIYHCDYFAENGYKEINQNLNPILRSAYSTVSVNSVLNDNVLGYIEELNSGDERARQYAQKLQYNYQNSLTHDGKSKPRKEDLFKKIKQFFKSKF